MRGALIHGFLLAVMLVYGYRTWTRDKTVEPTQGDVVLWERGRGTPRKVIELPALEETERVARTDARPESVNEVWVDQR